MASQKQEAASRANGARSRGPLTPEGKLRSSRSLLSRRNVKRGVLARALMTSLQKELKPETAIENLPIHKRAIARWRPGALLWQIQSSLERSEEFRAARTRQSQQTKAPEVQA